MSLSLTHSAFCRYIHLDELEAVRVKHPLLSATILLQGAQLIEFTPQNQENWLWLSAQAEYKKGASVRGGIPICWPWFGAAKRNPPSVLNDIKPQAQDIAHGIARTQLWQLSHLQEHVNGLELTFSLPPKDKQHTLWCGTITPKLNISMGKNHLQVALINHNTGEQDASISQALHTYLPTQDIRQTQIYGLENSLYVDALNHWLCFKQQGAVTFRAETDRIYRNALPHMRLHTPKYAMHIQSTGSNSTVIWNPWVKKSQRLSQFAHTDYQKMLCIETANVLDDHLKLAPKQTHTLMLRLTQQ